MRWKDTGCWCVLCVREDWTSVLNTTLRFLACPWRNVHLPCAGSVFFKTSQSPNKHVAEQVSWLDAFWNTVTKETMHKLIGLLMSSSNWFTAPYAAITADMVSLLQPAQSYNATFVYISPASHLSPIILLDFPPKQWLGRSSVCQGLSSSWPPVGEGSQG